MADITAARKWTILARVVAQQASRSHSYRAVMRAGGATARHLRRVLHQLWLEVTGFVFLALAGIGGIAFVREYNRHLAGRAGLSRVVIASLFTLLFGWFGVSSFWRIRKKA